MDLIFIMMLTCWGFNSMYEYFAVLAGNPDKYLGFYFLIGLGSFSSFFWLYFFIMGFKNTLKVCSTVLKKPFSSLPWFEPLLPPFHSQVLLGNTFLAGDALFFLHFLLFAKYEQVRVSKRESILYICIGILSRSLELDLNGSRAPNKLQLLSRPNERNVSSVKQIQTVSCIYMYWFCHFLGGTITSCL